MQGGPLPVWLPQKLVQRGAIPAQGVIRHHEQIPRKGEGQQAGERSYSHRGACGPPTPHCCRGISTGAQPHLSSRQVLVGTGLRTLSLPQYPTATGCLPPTGKEQPNPLSATSPIFDHQLLGIVHQDVELLIGDNDAVCLLCQLYHEPAGSANVTETL